MSVLETDSVSGALAVARDALLERLESGWGIRVDAPLRVCRGGLVNLVIDARSGPCRYAVRVSRGADAVSEPRRAALGGLTQPALPLALPLPCRLGGWSAAMGARVVSVWHWLPGDAPQRTPAAAYRVGRAVGLLGDTLLALGRAGLPEGRFARLARAAESDRAWLSELALRDPVAADTLALYLPPTPIGGWGRAPCHTDVFGANLVDDGAQVGVLDFDELGLDDPSVDRLAYLAWEVFSPEDGFRADLCAAYLQGLRSVDATPPPADAIAWLVFLNVAENVFNLALRRARPRHVYPLYAANLQRARLVLEQREALCRALSESNTPPPEGA